MSAAIAPRNGDLRFLSRAVARVMLATIVFQKAANAGRRFMTVLLQLVRVDGEEALRARWPDAGEKTP